MELYTERLRIRPMTPADAPLVYAYRSLPEVARFQSWQPRSVEEVTQRFIVHATQPPHEPDTWYPFAIELTSNGVLVGDCAIHLLSDIRQVELGITLAPGFQRQGYATEAVRGVLRHVFEDLGKHRAVASVDPRNTASMSLMRRVGFRLEGHLVQSVWFHGEWADDVVFGLLASEYKAGRVS